MLVSACNELHLLFAINPLSLQTFQSSYVVPFKCDVVSIMADRVDHLKSLGRHPPVEELCHCVTERYELLVSSLTKLCAATETCCQIAREFERGEEGSDFYE